MARRTLSGTLVGPGIKRKLRPGIIVRPPSFIGIPFDFIDVTVIIVVSDGAGNRWKNSPRRDAMKRRTLPRYAKHTHPITPCRRLVCKRKQSAKRLAPTSVQNRHLASRPTNFQSESRPLMRSTLISSTSSKPTDMRINPSVTPASARSSGVNRQCVVVAG